jgi:hypothetical protein
MRLRQTGFIRQMYVTATEELSANYANEYGVWSVCVRGVREVRG